MKVCYGFSSYFVTVCAHGRFCKISPKGKTVGSCLFLITSQIEWYNFHSHIDYCMEVTVLCLQKFKASAYAFSVHFS